MSDRLMTFNELSDDRYMLEGRYAEFSFRPGPVYVGKIIGTLWWPGKHIKKIQLAEVRLWDNAKKAWKKQSGWEISFDYGQFEMFRGPYETSTNDIFFILHSLYVCIFHDNGILKEPLGFGPLDAIHHRFMDPEPQEGTTT